LGRHKSTDRLDLGEKLIEAEETNAAIDWPVAIHHRVDQLVSLAVAEGERTTRKELVAALVLGAPESGDDLGRLLRAYRKSVARDALLNVGRSENVVELRRPGPGPRVRRTPSRS
jgi:hypothetical protein